MEVNISLSFHRINKEEEKDSEMEEFNENHEIRKRRFCSRV